MAMSSAMRLRCACTTYINTTLTEAGILSAGGLCVVRAIRGPPGGEKEAREAKAKMGTEIKKACDVGVGVKKQKDGRIVDRTRDLQIFSLTLSQLSYAPLWKMGRSKTDSK